MEQNFNINKVIEHYKLDTEEVASTLFPHVRYQKLALDRVLKGEACLNTDQLQALAKLAELKDPVDQFFEHVMVNSDDAAIKTNRIALLRNLHLIIGQTADISVLY